MEGTMREAVASALRKLGAEGVAFTIERPVDASHGDYATNAALVAAKAVGRNPRELAEVIALSLKETLGDKVARVEVAGPGFVNIRLAHGAVSLALAEADAQGEMWGTDATEAGKRVIIDYANPNPFKEMHIGHLMSAVIGESLARLKRSRGATVLGSSFGGDVGPHVAKALWGLKKEGITEITDAQEIGAAYARASAAYETDDSAKKEIDALNVRLYDLVARRHEAAMTGSDQELLSLWEKGREISMLEFKRLFAIFGTHLDYDFFDSDTVEPGLRVVKDGLAKGIFEESDGAVIYPGEKGGLHTLVFVTGRGTPTYETKDIGLAFLKEERFPSDESIIVTSNEQTGHFKVVLRALAELAPDLAKKTTHVPHGFLRLTSGKMSSREGNVITAAGLLKDVTEHALVRSPDPLVAEQVAVGAIKYMVLRQSPGSDIIFDPEKSLSLEGDSGPYLQYALVRAKSVLAQAGEKAAVADAPAEPYFIERLIMHFPEVAARAERELAPNLLVTYLTELAGAWNAFYAKERIIGGEHEVHKLLVARAFVNTMQNGLALLGIPTPERL